jgi:hypothetical protein
VSISGQILRPAGLLTNSNGQKWRFSILGTGVKATVTKAGGGAGKGAGRAGTQIGAEDACIRLERR